jgi:hypothetical protein
LCDGDSDDDLIKLDLFLATDPAIDDEGDRDLRSVFFFSGGIGEFKSSRNFLLLDGDPDDDLIKLDLLLTTDPAIDDKGDRDLRFSFFFSGGIGEFNSSRNFLLLDGDPDDDLIKLDLLLSTDPAIDSERGRDLRFKFFFPGGSCEFKSSCSFLGFGFGLVGLVLMDGNMFSNSDESGSSGVHITGSLSFLRFEDLETDCFSIRDGFLVPLRRYRWRDLDFRWVIVMLPFFFDGISQSMLYIAAKMWEQIADAAQVQVMLRTPALNSATV